MAKPKKAATGGKSKARGARKTTKTTVKRGPRDGAEPKPRSKPGSKPSSNKAATPRSPSADAGRPEHRAKPFVKWAGGKRQLLREITHHVPRKFGTYHEPFLGGGAVFFSLPLGTRARLSDLNERLVRTYKGIKQNVGEVIALLNGYSRERGFFEEMRQRDIDKASDIEVAAWFIFLNKTGFNGLYRVNSKNRFNVPFGDHKKGARFFDEANLRACASALQTAEIEHRDFSEALKDAREGDFVYLDPPYVPLSVTANFTSYTVEGFTYDDQKRLRDAARALKDRRVHVVLSNSSSAADLYKREDGFHTIPVLASRPVNSRGDRRGKITELLII